MFIIACSTPDSTAFDAERPWRQPGDVIDSILPMEEYERRFRDGLNPVTAFTGGAESPEKLAEAFVASVASRDSVALRELLVTRAEFAWLVFPQHVYRRPPYEMDPGLFWMQLQQSSAKGLSRVLERLGGHSLRYRNVTCQADTVQVTAGPAKLWGHCELEFLDGNQLQSGQLFGSIVERDGVAKLLSYANMY
jgi:hypothetical protein